MAWCPEAERFDAFASALSALVGESGSCIVGDSDGEEVSLTPVKAAELIRPIYEKYGTEMAHLNDVQARSGRLLNLCAQVHVGRRDYFPGFAFLELGFWAEPFIEGYLLPPELPRLKRGGPSSVAMEAGVAWQIAIWDAYDILVRFCSASPAITTGCCTEGPDWRPPITAAGTYHADGYPGRDLALSWIYLHEKEPIDLAVGASVDVLRARVEASPRGSSVWVIDEERLAREQVLAALDLPPKVLLEALQTAEAERRPAWKAIEQDLLHLLGEIVKASAEEREMIPVTEEHIRFIEEQSPAFVQHLDNGAVVLIAHPDRTLWPLWSEALRLLGIRP